MIQNLKTKVSYYEQAADNKAPPPRPNPYATFAAPSRVSLRPEKSPSFNRRNTTLHVYPPQTGTQEKKGDPSVSLLFIAYARMHVHARAHARPRTRTRTHDTPFSLSLAFSFSHAWIPTLLASYQLTILEK